MEMNEYQRLALRTAANKNLSRELLIANRALGLAGETGELADLVWRYFGPMSSGNPPVEKFRNELGDVTWYIATAADIFGISMVRVDAAAAPLAEDMQIDAITFHMVVNAGKVCDRIKKHLTHGHALDQTVLTEELGHTLKGVIAMAKFLDFDFATVAEANIAKLRARYPDGFSEERSQNRAAGDV